VFDDHGAPAVPTGDRHIFQGNVTLKRGSPAGRDMHRDHRVGSSAHLGIRGGLLFRNFCADQEPLQGIEGIPWNRLKLAQVHEDTLDICPIGLVGDVWWFKVHHAAPSSRSDDHTLL
jgi:hypothetical protein